MLFWTQRREQAGRFSGQPRRFTHTSRNQLLPGRAEPCRTPRRRSTPRPRSPAESLQLRGRGAPKPPALRAVHSSLRLPACSAGAGSSSALHGSRCGFLVLSDGYFCPSARFEVYGSKSKLTLFGTGCCSETKITDNPPSPKS